MKQEEKKPTLEELLSPGWIAPGDPTDYFRPGRGAYLIELVSEGREKTKDSKILNNIFGYK
jgi:hypothetical protein